MLPRVLEPEVMDTPDEARDYDAMDHVEVNARFCDDLLAFTELPARVLDVGTGTARIPIALAARAPHLSIVAIDLAENMLAIAKENVSRAGLASRVTLDKVDAKHLPWKSGSFGAVVSNSIVHHIPEPAAALAEMWRVLASGGALFVRDLVRPASVEEVSRLVALYEGTAPADPGARRGWESQRELLRASLCAALTVDEVAAMVAPLGIRADAVRITSDRHFTLAAKKP